MSFNAAGAVEIPLTVFGSLVTEMAPVDCPEGVSPDNQDVVYAPGKVDSRPGLAKVFSTPFTNAPSVMWSKSFVSPAGGIENLFLDSNGIVWWEDFTNSPGVYTQLYAVAPGSYAKSVTAFGREYIGFSDGLHGSDLPIQWDGTNIDPVTQDGPGAPPVVASIALPSVSMVATGAAPVVNLTECDPAAQGPGGSFAQINCFTNDDLNAKGVQVGSIAVIAGNGSAAMNGTWSVIAVYPNSPGLSLFVVSAFLPAGTVFGLGGTATIGGGVTMTRAGNIVTVKTAVAHQLQPGYQVQITGVPGAAIGGGISSIVINNEDLPGLATVTTASAHGLVPGIFVSIAGVTAVVVGTGISAIVRAGNIVTVTTSSAHGLSPGAVVTIAGVGTASFNTTAPVLNVNSTTVFTFAQVDTDAVVGAGGTVSLNWPIPQSVTPSYFQVQSTPTATTFQIAVSYSDGTWGAAGTVAYAWDGIFFVLTVPSTTLFTYQQYGPNATSSTVGKVTPYGQAAPGIHQCQVLFLYRTGYISRPSPPVKFVANGGQYISVSNIPTGTNSVVARILAFTGAGGAFFFYIPVVPQVNNQPVGTATQINDNSTTGVILDFSDNTLFAALGISIPGNNLANQIILDGALGFGFYGSRLITWGQRNRIQNLLNMGFDGGSFPTTPTIPTGWTPTAGVPGGALAAGLANGFGWQISGAGSIFQGFYQDAYGIPIATPKASYLFRAWIKGVGPTVRLAITSASTAFSSTATLTGVAAGGSFVQGAFNNPMPAVIPTDMILTLSGPSGTALVDAMSIIFATNPFSEGVLYGSYASNPEAFDGVSGKFGPAMDTHKVMDLGIIRNSLYLFTRDPSGRIHATNDNGVTEPAGWSISEVGANCGLLSAFCLTKSQADDASTGGGEEWLAWASSSGARIFGGDQPWKLSQEIQPDWDSINSAAVLTIWALNDPSARVIYFGLPTGGNTTPNLIYPMNYRQLDTPYQIAMSAPYHPSFAGHLIATDNTRKWTRWNLKINGASLMYRGAAGGAASLSPVFLNGIGNGNVYTLSPAKLTDDDYGLIVPYYTIFFVPSHMQEAALRDSQGLPLGSHRKLLQYVMAFCTGTGFMNITALVDALGNPWPIAGQRILAPSPVGFDLEWTGGNAIGQRIALKFGSTPNGGTDNGFSLQKVIAVMKAVRHLPVRGSAA